MQIRTTIALSCLLLFGAGEAVAQAPGIELKINPRIGLYAPLSDLGEIQAAGQTLAAEQSGSLALGLGVELSMIALPVDVRLNLDYATGSEISTTIDGVEQGDPIETTLLAVVGDVIFRPLPKVIVAQPYLFAGGGLKQYDVKDTDAATFQAESDPTIHLGFGLDVGLGPMALNAELSDYLSWYELEEGADSEMQHDLFVSIGFSINIL